MGLGLELRHLPIWAAYCVAMVLAEAFFIGLKIGFSGWESLGISLGANFATAWICATGGCFAPFLHSTFIGSRANPNPFLNAATLLLILAFPSALIEGAVWSSFLRRKGSIREWSVVGRSLGVHLVCVPLGMAILLIPERPLPNDRGVFMLCPRGNDRSVVACLVH